MHPMSRPSETAISAHWLSLDVESIGRTVRSRTLLAVAEHFSVCGQAEEGAACGQAQHTAAEPNGEGTR